MIPTIETEHFRLIPPNKDCFDLYKRFYTNAIASSSYGGPLTVGETWARLKSDLGSWHLSGFGVWVIQEKGGNALIGTCGFWESAGWPRELTWWLLPDAQGQGVAFEVSSVAISHAYTVFNWDIVETYMNDDNIPARRLVQKLGGVSTQRQIFPDGLERDMFSLPNRSIPLPV